tara:strand:+ start:218 stop:538 length:321 start_codon:yes stop_codon:yes gene_type:complete
MAHGILANYKADSKFREDWNYPSCTISNGRIEAWRSETPQPTESEIEAWYDKLVAEGYFANELIRHTRTKFYPPIGDQLDDLYHKGAFSDEMKEKIKAVKDDNPKE